MSPGPYISGEPQPGDGAAAGIDDSDLIARIRKADTAAFAAIYDRYSRLVYSVALRVLRNESAAEDVLQEIFMKLWRNPEMFDASRGALGPWLAVTARNRSIDRIRRRVEETELTDSVAPTNIDFEQQAVNAALLTRVKGVLQQLPEVQRSALNLAYFEGLTHAEIAARTGEPLGTIKGRIRGAIAALGKALRHDG
jgi:RNA polymerase sigma-70 factor, ECF subfamily